MVSERRVTRLHGDRPQGQRDEAMAGFRDGKYRVLVATDIAARGLDVADVEHVVNFDFPRSPEDYVHRIGRTARLAATGKATSFVTPADREFVRDLEKHLGSRPPMESPRTFPRRRRRSRPPFPRHRPAWRPSGRRPSRRRPRGARLPRWRPRPSGPRFRQLARLALSHGHTRHTTLKPHMPRTTRRPHTPRTVRPPLPPPRTGPASPPPPPVAATVATAAAATLPVPATGARRLHPRAISTDTTGGGRPITCQ